LAMTYVLARLSGRPSTSATACLGLCVEGDERFARCDTDPQLEPVVGRELPYLERSANRSLGIVLMADGRAEERHDCIADELLDRATEALELLLQPSVIRGENGCDVLGIHLLGLRGEADEIAEQRGDDLPLLTRRRHVTCDRNRTGHGVHLARSPKSGFARAPRCRAAPLREERG
jgi:hypothetical protein